MPENALATDASLPDASLVDSLVDAMANMPDAALDAALADAGVMDASSDGGASLLDASLQPPADADLSDAAVIPSVPLGEVTGTFVGIAGGSVTVSVDAGLAP